MSETVEVSSDLSHLTFEIPCQFGIIDTSCDYQAEFTEKGTVVIERHAVLPPLFWAYTILDKQGKLLFSTKMEVGEQGLDTAIHDYFGDGRRGRLDCLFTSNSEEIPAGMILSCERNLFDNQARDLVFHRFIRGATMSWYRIACSDKGREYFRVNFSNRQNDSVHLRPLTSKEKDFMKACHEFGLFLSSDFLYPLEEGKSLLFNLVTCYQVRTPWQLKANDFYMSKKREMSFGQAPEMRFDAYRQKSDVFVGCHIVEREVSEPEAARAPLEEVVAEISNGSPDSISWEKFQSLFVFRCKSSTPGQLYGEFGALRTKER